MKKFFKKHFMSIGEICLYLLGPAVVTAFLVMSFDITMLGLKPAYTAIVLAIFAFGVGLQKYDWLCRARKSAELAEIKARRDAVRKALKEQEAEATLSAERLIWWDEHFAEISSWREQITGAGREG